MKNTNQSITSLPTVRRELVDVALDFMCQMTLPLLVLVAGAAFLSVFFVGFWMSCSKLPYVMGVDLNVVATVQKHLSGKDLYTDPCNVPFDIAQYPPLYYEVCSVLLRALVIGPSEFASILLVTRLVSLSFSILACVVSFLLMINHLDVKPAVAFAATAVGYVSASPWLSTARPDSLYLFLTICTCYAAISAVTKPYPIRDSVAAIILAFLTLAAKQSGVVTLFFVILFLLQFSLPRVRFVVLVCILVGISTTLLLILQYGQHTIANVVRGVDNGISPDYAWRSAYYPYFGHWSILVATSMFALLSWPRDQCHKPVFQFFFQYLIILLVFSTITALKWGSGKNYFTEFSFLSTICVAAWFGRKESACHRDTQNVSAVVGRLICISAIVVLLTQATQEVYWNYWLRIDPGKSLLTPIPRNRWDRYEPIRQFVHESFVKDGPCCVLSFVKPLNLLWPEACIVPQAEIAGIGYGRNVWDFSAFPKLVRDRKVRFVMSEERVLPEAFLGADLSGFEFVGQMAGLNVFRLRRAREFEDMNID